MCLVVDDDDVSFDAKNRVVVGFFSLASRFHPAAVGEDGDAFMMSALQESQTPPGRAIEVTRREAFFGDDDEVSESKPAQRVEVEANDEQPKGETGLTAETLSDDDTGTKPKSGANSDGHSVSPNECLPPMISSEARQMNEDTAPLEDGSGHIPGQPISPERDGPALQGGSHGDNEPGISKTPESSVPKAPGYKSKTRSLNLSIDVSEGGDDNKGASLALGGSCLSRRSARVHVEDILKGLPLCTVLNFNRLVMRLQARVRGSICRKDRRLKRNFGKTGAHRICWGFRCS